ncbi:MAG: sensor histidine kinase [Nitriliruptoraceae bacterium]
MDEFTATSADSPPRAIHAWLEAFREELDASRWSIALLEGEVWNVRSDHPSLHDGIVSQLLNDGRLHASQRATLVDVGEAGDAGARLRTAGVDHVLIVPGGPRARIVLVAPDVERARKFISSTRGLGTTFDLAEAIRAEQLAHDLVALSRWWPDDGSPPATSTLEGTMLAGRIAAAADTARGSAQESRRTSLLRERARIASVIHEGITQVLTNVAVQLEVVRLVSDDVDRLREMVEGARHAVLEALESLRMVIFDLTPPEEDWTDLVAGLRGFVADFGAQWGVHADVDVQGQPRDVDADVVSMGFAFVQEALTNVRRHAQVDHARVIVSFRADDLEITVIDQGVGVDDAAEPTEPDDLRSHQGLKIVESRVRLLDGTFTLDSTPGEGTTVRVRVPA